MTEARLPVCFAGGQYEQRPQPTRLAFHPDLLDRPLATLTGVSAAVARRLASVGIETAGDLLEHYPRRYEDYRDRRPIAALKVGEEATVRGAVGQVTLERTARRGVPVIKVLIRDESGVLEAIWFNQAYLTKVLTEGMTLSLRGALKPQRGHLSFAVKSHEIIAEQSETVHTEGVVPVYPASEQVSARLLRSVMQTVLPHARRAPDPVPSKLRISLDLPRRADAMVAVHDPASISASASDW